MYRPWKSTRCFWQPVQNPDTADNKPGSLKYDINQNTSGWIKCTVLLGTKDNMALYTCQNFLSINRMQDKTLTNIEISFDVNYWAECHCW